MKYEITHLKAPWPEGAKVGDVFDVDGPVPAWALGKVKEAGDGAKATLKMPRRKAHEGEDGDGPLEATTKVGKEQAEAETIEQQAQRERDEAEAAERVKAPTAEALAAADAKKGAAKR